MENKNKNFLVSFFDKIKNRLKKNLVIQKVSERDNIFRLLSGNGKYNYVLTNEIIGRNYNKFLNLNDGLKNKIYDYEAMYKDPILSMAMEFIVDDIGMRIGEMERFMDVSADFMNNMDLENAMYEEKGLKALDDWANKVDEKFDAANYQSPVKALEKGNVNFQQREKVSVTQAPTNTTTNSSTGQKSKYF